MAMMEKIIGRGRARGYTPASHTDNHIRRPGEVVECEQGLSVENIVRNVSMLSLRGGTIKAVELDKVVQDVKFLVKDPDELRQVATAIHQTCLKDADFVPMGVQLCSRLSLVEVGSTKFRALVLGFLQHDFNERETRRFQSKKLFVNSVKFLGEIFQNMRMPDGSAFHILEGPIFYYLKMLIDPLSTLDEFKLFETLFQLLGKELHEAKPERLEDLLQDVRLQILESSASKPKRAILLRSLELANRKWIPLTKNAEDFYTKQSEYD